ncbi:flavin reductase family protein [Nocardia mangyaensis]|uniref:flavin reductase family protein n=1 Tax=Nocardia mangyaensis TaxID=2213200 RepID=UPI002675689E|nr:flavin reductase family protein [Nocardia mangyaensis]MDO3650603.1 flavin reductase family protein [Nocardia mangyaensis]
MTGLHDIPADARGLRHAFAHFPNGVVAVCADIGGVPHGMAVSTFVPVSLDPPLVSFCVQNTSSTWPRLTGAGRLGISLLGAGQQQAAQTLGARDGDRFHGLELHHGHGEAVLIGGSSAWIEGDVYAEVPAGDHRVVLVRVQRLATSTEIEPLLFHRSRFRRLQNDETKAGSVAG